MLKRRAVGLSGETESSLPLAYAKQTGISITLGTNVALPAIVGRGITFPVELVLETDQALHATSTTPFPVVPGRTVSVGARQRTIHAERRLRIGG